MGADQVVGDGANLTVYERPDGSRYALDKKGRGEEWDRQRPIFGRARFDARKLASGVWKGSRSTPQTVIDETANPLRRARRHRAS